MVNVDNVYQGEGNEKCRERLCSFSKSVLVIPKMPKRRKGLVFSKDSRPRLPKSFYSLKGKRGTL